MISVKKGVYKTNVCLMTSDGNAAEETLSFVFFRNNTDG
jgi:hypothetical protein